MIERFDLGAIGLDYFIENMRSGGTLARAMSSRNIGGVFALLPSDVSGDAINDFEHGGILEAPPRVGNMQRVPNTDDALAAEVLRAVSNSPFAVVVLEDEIARRSDFANRKASGLVFDNDNVYHVIAREQLEAPDMFLDRLSWARSTATTRGFVVSPDQPIRWSDGGEWTRGQLEQLSAHTRLAFLSAYDGESFLIAELEAAGR